MSDELRVAFLRRKWDEAERKVTKMFDENLRLREEIKRLLSENSGLRMDAILRR